MSFLLAAVPCCWMEAVGYGSSSVREATDLMQTELRIKVSTRHRLRVTGRSGSCGRAVVTLTAACA